jgi:zinc protease
MRWASIVACSLLLGASACARQPAVPVSQTNRIRSAHRDQLQTDSDILSRLPQPIHGGQIVERRAVPEIGVTEWRLQNGVRVVVKPTRFDPAAVTVVGRSPGGTSLVRDADFESAKFAAWIVRQGGLGHVGPEELHRALRGRDVSLTPQIEETYQGISGRASCSEFPLLLELTYASFTAPRRDPVAFARWRAGIVDMLGAERGGPWGPDELELLATENHRRRAPLTVEFLRKIDLNTAFAVYKQRFADASAFVFVIVGDVRLGDLEPLVALYFGGLPGVWRHERPRRLELPEPSGIRTTTLFGGKQSWSLVRMRFHGALDWSRERAASLRLLTVALRVRLGDAFQRDFGMFHRIFVSSELEWEWQNHFQVTFSFTCPPDHVEQARELILKEIQAIKEGAIVDAQLDRVRRRLDARRAQQVMTNGYWAAELLRACLLGYDPRSILDEEQSVTADELRAAARVYLPSDQYLLVVLNPRSAAPH